MHTDPEECRQPVEDLVWCDRMLGKRRMPARQLLRRKLLRQLHGMRSGSGRPARQGPRQTTPPRANVASRLQRDLVKFTDWRIAHFLLLGDSVHPNARRLWSGSATQTTSMMWTWRAMTALPAPQRARRPNDSATRASPQRTGDSVRTIVWPQDTCSTPQKKSCSRCPGKAFLITEEERR